MPTKKKKTVSKKRPEKYEEPLQLKESTSFMDIINASVKDAKNNTPKK
jgi:hypothetical protein